MKLLYIDTTTDWIVLGLYEITETSLERIRLRKGSFPRESSFRLVGDIQNLFKETGVSEADRLVCAHGPGSFTGLRIAVSTTRNLAQLWKKPCLGLDTLEIYSSYYFHKYNHPSLVLLDARMKKVYAGSYSEKGFSGSLDLDPNQLKENYEIAVLKIYSDFQYPDSLSLPSDYPEPDSILKTKINEIYHLNLVDHNYQTLTPNYIRGTYAEGKEHVKIHP